MAEQSSLIQISVSLQKYVNAEAGITSASLQQLSAELDINLESQLTIQEDSINTQLLAKDTASLALTLTSGIPNTGLVFYLKTSWPIEVNIHSLGWMRVNDFIEVIR